MYNIGWMFNLSNIWATVNQMDFFITMSFSKQKKLCKPTSIDKPPKYSISEVFVLNMTAVASVHNINYQEKGSRQHCFDST